MQRVRREDTVLVMKGKDRGRSGSVRKVIPDKKKVIMTGINIGKRRLRPRVDHVVRGRQRCCRLAGDVISIAQAAERPEVSHGRAAARGGWW